MSVPNAATKDTIYIDAEDEITAIIDKVRGSQAKIVALVLPKRSQTLQSIVNLKLLKRTAAQAKKNLVLITSDPNLLPIAGAVGMLVAKTPQSKPEIPAAPSASQEATANNIETVTADDEPVVDANQPVGALAGDSPEETIELDNDKDTAVNKPKAAAAGLAGKKLFNKRLKVPDFDRFRLLLFGGIALVILLIVGSLFAFVILPKATIHVKTDTTNVSTDLTLTAKTSATELDKDNLVIPATKKELKKTENEKAPATGQKNVGEKATGTVSLKNCTNSDDEITLPAGSPMTAGGLTFVTTEPVTLPQSSFSGGGSCKTGSKTVNVAAQAAGDNYNLSSREYSVAGFSNVEATGSNMSGGTTKLVQVVSQQDINNAKDKLLERLNAGAKSELKTQFDGENLQALEDTYGAGDPAVSPTPAANTEGSDVTVSVTITYTELGVKKDDLKQLVEDNVKKNIDASKQVIRDNGLSNPTIRVLDKKSADEARFSLSTISVAGPQLDTDGIKKEVAGKKKGATIKAIQSRPGIQDVQVDYSPFWVFSTPKRTSRITIIFDQSNAQ
jgi:hypothetical protein